MTTEHPWKTQSGFIDSEKIDPAQIEKCFVKPPPRKIQSLNCAEKILSNQEIAPRPEDSFYRKVCRAMKQLKVGFISLEEYGAKLEQALNEKEAEIKKENQINEVLKVFEISRKDYDQFSTTFSSFAEYAKDCETELTKGLKNVMEGMVKADYPHLFKREYNHGFIAGALAACVAISGLIIALDICYFS